MGAIKEFKELNIGIKTTILTILSQIPFFFISVYLFKHELIDKIGSKLLSDIDLYFLVSICFGFSLIWFFVNVILTMLIADYRDKHDKVKTKTETVYVLTMIYSIGYLSIAIIVNYYYLKSSFHCFLAYAFSFIVVKIIWTYVIGLIRTYISKKMI